jgi:hypothetical protein
VDAYSRYVWIYGIANKSSSSIIKGLKIYQAEHSPVGTYGYLDTEKVCGDAGKEITSNEFLEYCLKAGIKLTLAAPKKRGQNARIV